MSDTLLDNIVQGGEYKPKFWLPTPSHEDNSYLINGGIPSNSFIQIQGKNESSFKTTFAAQMLAKAQEMGLNVGFVDAEIAMENEWIRGIGVDTDKWFITQPTSGEVGWELCYKMIEEHDCKVVVLDSLDSMVPSVLRENEVGDAAIGNHAKMHSAGIRKALPIMVQHDAIIIGINHKKVNITDMGARGFNAGGGKAIGFYSKLILELSTGSANSKRDKDSIDLNIFIEKNKLGRSYVNVKEQVEQGVGIVPEYSILKSLLKSGDITKAGSWYEFQGDPIGQGANGAIQWLKENGGIIDELAKSRT